MAKRAFLDDNKGRDYPLLKGASYVPFTSILACGFVIGPNTGFVAGQHNVTLSKVKREFGRVWFYFTCNAPGLLLQEIIFSRLEDAAMYTLEYADSSSTEDGSASESLSVSTSLSLSQSSSLSVSQSEDMDSLNVCGYIDDFSGFLITGALDDLLAVLPDNSILESTVAATGIVEPALLQDLSNTYVRSINLANIDRTRYVAPPGCEGDDAQGDRDIFVNTTCIQGKIVFTPGANANVSQNNFTNSVTFSAVVGAGTGEPCEQMPLYAGETTPAGSIYLEGGPSCNEVIRSISGASGPRADLSAEGGVNISYEPSENKVIIDVNLKALSTCENTLLVGETLYEDCHHEAGMPGEGPGGGRGVTELTLPSMAFSGLGLFAHPDERVGLGALTLPSMIATGGGGSSGSFSTGFSGYGALTLPSFSSSGSGTIPFNIYGPGAMVFPKLAMSGSGTGTFAPPAMNETGSGGVAMSIMTFSGDGTFIPFEEPPPLGGDILFPTPGILEIHVGYAGGYLFYASEASFVMRYGTYLCYGPAGEGGHVGGKGGGAGTGYLSEWPATYIYGRIRHNGGDGKVNYTLDAYGRGGGGGSSAGPDGPGNPGGLPYTWSGGDSSFPGWRSYDFPGQGCDGFGYGPGGHNGEWPGGGGGGGPWGDYSISGRGGAVLIILDFGGSTVEQFFPNEGDYQIDLAGWPGLKGGTIECWGAGGAGGDVTGLGVNFSGGGGGGYSKSYFTTAY